MALCLNCANECHSGTAAENNILICNSCNCPDCDGTKDGFTADVTLKPILPDPEDSERRRIFLATGNKDHWDDSDYM